MTETPEPHTEPPAAATEPSEGSNRLGRIAAWVGIVAGVVFVVAVIFFSGVYAGSELGGDEHGPGEHHEEWSHAPEKYLGEDSARGNNQDSEDAPGPSTPSLPHP